MPVMTDVSQLLSAFAIVSTVAVGLAKPWGHPFNVTAKGRSTRRLHLPLGYRRPFPVHCRCDAARDAGQPVLLLAAEVCTRLQLNIIWSVCSIAVLLLTIHICIEPPKRRRDERFVTGEPAMLVDAERPDFDLCCEGSFGRRGPPRMFRGLDRRHGGPPDVSRRWRDCGFRHRGIIGLATHGSVRSGSRHPPPDDRKTVHRSLSQ